MDHWEGADKLDHWVILREKNQILSRFSFGIRSNFCPGGGPGGATFHGDGGSGEAHGGAQGRAKEETGGAGGDPNGWTNRFFLVQPMEMQMVVVDALHG